MNKFVLFFKDSYYELTRKITWLTWPQAQQYTIIIIVFIIIFSLIVWAMDLASSNGMKLVYSVFQ